MNRVYIFIFLLLTGLPVAADQVVGFLLNNNRAAPTFVRGNTGWTPIDPQTRSKMIGTKANLFFNGKIIGEITLFGPHKECFKKYTAEETQNSKNCPESGNANFDSADSEPPSIPTGPCPGDLGPPRSCPSTEKAGVMAFSSPEILEAKLVGPNATPLRSAFRTKRVTFDWGIFSVLKTHERPILFSNQNLSDPDGWHHVEFETIPAVIRKRILQEVLSTRRIQKCSLESAKLKSISLNEGNLVVGRTYQSQKGDKFAAPVKIKIMKDLVDCNGNEMGVPAAYVVYYDQKAHDLLKAQDWNYRNLELLEAADANHDAVSELYFADYEYDRDGFSVFDFKTGALTKYGDSSH